MRRTYEFGFTECYEEKEKSRTMIYSERCSLTIMMGLMDHDIK